MRNRFTPARSFFTLAAALAASLSSPLAAQSGGDGFPVGLPLDPTRVAVRAPEGACAPPSPAELGFEPTELEAWPIAGWWLAGLPPEDRREERVRARVAAIAARPDGPFASPVFAGGAGGLAFATPWVLARFDPGLPEAGRREALDSLGTIRGDAWGGMEGAFRVEAAARDGFAVLAAAAALASRPGVRFAEVDLVFTGRGAGVPNDPLFDTSWGLHNTGQSGGALDVDLDAPEAWTFTGGHPAIRVLVLDVGVQQQHPDLLQVPGADFTGEGGGGGPVNACDNHGTAVAGCITGAIDNGRGTAGIAPGCRIASARVFISTPACDGSWTSMASWTVDALDWAFVNGARVSNNSNEYAVPSAAVEQKYAQTRAGGMVHFASAGDAGAAGVGWPASLPDVNAVSAIDRTGQLDPLSSFGPEVAFAAPGKEIQTTDRTGAAGFEAGDSTVQDGSSYASAFAAGVAALALSRNAYLDAAAVEQLLQAGATDLGPPGLDDSFGWGLVNAWQAVLQAAPAGATERVHVGTLGDAGTLDSFFPSLSANGRYVAFDSNAPNLVPNDTNGVIDGFWHDRLTGRTVRVSLTSGGVEGNSFSGDVWISGDGRFVAFDSLASNLVPGDTNNLYDAFVHDTLTKTTERVSVATDGSEGDKQSFIPSISFDGSRVAFRSKATNLVPDDTNAFDDVFVRDRLAGTTVRASLGTGGVEGNHASNEPEISSDGRFVAFQSLASNFFPGDVNGLNDVFVRDLEAGTLELVSKSSAGVPGNLQSINAAISDDGRYVCFESEADNLVPGDTNGVADAFVHDRQSGTTVRASVDSAGVESNGITRLPRISGNGRFVGFYCAGTNLVPGDTNGTFDLFVHDLQTGVTERASVSSAGGEALGGFTSGTLCNFSRDGRFVVFENRLAGLVPDDANGIYDIFVRDRLSSAAWCDLASGTPGTAGTPSLVGWGGLAGGATTEFALAGALPSTAGALVMGLQPLYLPLFGGILVPDLSLLFPIQTDAAGLSSLTLTWPTPIAPGLELYVQDWLFDPGAAEFLAVSNALGAVAF